MNELAYKNPDLNILVNHSKDGYPILAQILEEKIQKKDERKELILPNLRAFGNESIGIFSDYSGEGAGDYDTYTVLVCGLNIRDYFHHEMKCVRREVRLHKKEIAYKDFGMGQIQRALPSYLQALDNFLPGFLLTVAVEKKITSLFGPQTKQTKKEISNLLKSSQIGAWKPDVAEKALRVTHIVGFLILPPVNFP